MSTTPLVTVEKRKYNRRTKWSILVEGKIVESHYLTKKAANARATQLQTFYTKSHNRSL